MRQRRSLMKLATPLLVGRGIAAVLTFVIPVVLARALDQDSYGTYKQFFLIASTVYLIGQAGLVASLYYFVPRAGRAEAGRFITQALVGLLIVGGVAAGIVFLGAGAIARRFSNPALLPLAAPLALYLWAFLGAAPLEVSLTTTKRTGWAGLSYAVSDLVRTAALILPIKLGGGMVALAWAAAGWATLRLIAAWTLALSSRLGPAHLPSRTALRSQLGYSLPFAGAVLLATMQMQLPQYLVAALSDASTYAIYAVGVLQIPLTDMLYTPVAEVMMVRLASAPASGAPKIFHEAVARLAMFFLPLTGFALAAAPALIPTLYTSQYVASVPIFMIALCELPLSALPVDGLLRSLNRTGTLFRIGLLRLGVAVVAVPVGLELIGLPGAMLGYIATQWTAKLLLLRAAARRLNVPATALVPWPEVKSWAFRGAAVFVAVTLLRRFGPWHGWIFIAAAIALAAGVWGIAALSARELRAPAEAGLSSPSFPPATTAGPAPSAPLQKEARLG
jgi:O-antigen/teichoic acid export membrane protein